MYAEVSLPTSGELFWAISLTILIFIQLSTSFFKNEYYSFWNPMTIISVVYLYYCLAGPISCFVNQDFALRTINHRQYFYSAWQGATVSYFTMFIGFLLGSRKGRKLKLRVYSDEKWKKFAINVFLISLCILILFAGPQFYRKINFMDNRSTGYQSASSLAGYMLQAFLFFISACVFMLKPIKNNKNVVLFVLLLIFTVMLYVNEAFRFRLVLLVYSLMSAYHLYNAKKVNVKLILSVMIPFLFVMGALEIARSYGRGINVNKLESHNAEDVLSESLGETAVFMATGNLIDTYRNHYEFTGMDFFLGAITMPIPRKLWPSKPGGEYMINAIHAAYKGANGAGQAVLNYGEYYVSFGWLGIILIPFIIGIILKRIWSWFLFNKEYFVVTVLYSVFSASLYVLISRGYLAQYVTALIFVALPSFYIYKKSLINE